MQVRVGESRQTIERSGTFDSLTIGAVLQHKNKNAGIAISDFLPDGVNIKVILKRNNAQHIIMQDNLLILGTFSTLQRGYHEFMEGEHLTFHTADDAEVLSRAVTIPFGAHVRIDTLDELLVELTVSKASVSANIDTSVSYVEFTVNPSIGYETGLPVITSEVITEHSTSQTFHPGDNVTQIALLNFDQNDLKNPVLASVTLGSDKLDQTWTFEQLVQRRSLLVDNIGRRRFGTSLPILASAPTVIEGLPFLPQSFLIYCGVENSTDLDTAKITASFVKENVASSQNYFVFRRYVSDRATIAAAQVRADKHLGENISKLPVQTNLTAASSKVS